MKTKFLFNKGFEVFNRERYVVANPITKRACAETYRLTRIRDGKPFLMKVYTPWSMPEKLKFREGPRLLAYLNSSGISKALSIIAWGEFSSEGGKLFPYVISDYFECGVLSDKLLTDGPVDALSAVSICLDIAGILLGLRAPEGCSFVHCDICPDNIMFGRDENGDLRAHLVDNDHLIHIGDGEEHDNYWSDVDLRYTAPEIMTWAGIFSNSDVYSLGVILHECYYGRYPWALDLEDYELADTADKRDMLMHARSTDPLRHSAHLPLDYERYGIIIDDIVKDFTIFDYEDDYSLAESIRPSLLQAWQMLLAAKSAISSPDLAEGYEYDAYLSRFVDMRATRFSDIFPETGPRTRETPEKTDNAPDSPAAQKIEASSADDSEFTNVELGYSPLVRMHNPGAGGFKDVAGMEQLKEYMQKKLLYFLKNPGLAREYKIDLPNGMLLYGPPGCGKTFFAEKFAEESGFNYALVKASDLGSTWVHGAQGKIGMLFKEARAKKPCIICLDEFDAFAPRRETITNANLSGEVNEFLSQLNNCGKDRVFVIATTNNPEIIDPAMLRSGRLDRCIYIPEPDSQARRAVFRLCVEKRPHSGDIDYKLLAARTECYVTSDICGIVNDAAMNAAYSRKPVSGDLLLQAIDNWKPTVSRDLLEKHREIRARMESASPAEIAIALNDKILN